MQNIGINPDIVYDSRHFDDGTAGFQVGQVATDGQGHAFIFKRFSGDVLPYGIVEVDGENARAMTSYTPGRRFGFIRARGIFGATPESPSYAWIQIYGETLARFTISGSIAPGSRVYMDVGGFVRSTSGGGSANIIGLEIREATVQNGMTEVQLNYPIVR